MPRVALAHSPKMGLTEPKMSGALMHHSLTTPEGMAVTIEDIGVNAFVFEFEAIVAR